jgi:hypothetical protein
MEFDPFVTDWVEEKGVNSTTEKKTVQQPEKSDNFAALDNLSQLKRNINYGALQSDAMQSNPSSGNSFLDTAAWSSAFDTLDNTAALKGSGSGASDTAKQTGWSSALDSTAALKGSVSGASDTAKQTGWSSAFDTLDGTVALNPGSGIGNPDTAALTGWSSAFDTLETTARLDESSGSTAALEPGTLAGWSRDFAAFDSSAQTSQTSASAPLATQGWGSSFDLGTKAQSYKGGSIDNLAQTGWSSTTSEPTKESSKICDNTVAQTGWSRDFTALDVVVELPLNSNNNVKAKAVGTANVAALDAWEITGKALFFGKNNFSF